MGTDLFWSSELTISLNCIGYSQEDWFMLLVEGMNICSLGGPFECLPLFCSIAYFLLEGFNVGGVSFGEDAKGAFGDVIGS
jgi:hypothetical protein